MILYIYRLSLHYSPSPESIRGVVGKASGKWWRKHTWVCWASHFQDNAVHR